MKPVGKQTLLTILVFILVALNIGLITFMWYTQRTDSGPGGKETANFLIKELNFDKTQEQQYLQLQKQHCCCLSCELKLFNYYPTLTV